MLYIYFLLYVLESPIKYIGFTNDLIFLGYVKDIFGLFLILIFLLKNINNKFNLLIIFLILLFYILYELILGHSAITSIFGFKEYVPLIIGVIYWKKILNFKIFSDYAFWIVFTGLITESFFLELPWANAEFNIIGFDVVGSKIVIANDIIKRHSGFSPLYTMANCWISLFFALSFFNAKNKFYKFLLFIALLYASYLTFVKTEFFAIILFIIFLRYLSYKIIKKYFILLLFTLFIAIPIVLPATINIELLSPAIFDDIDVAGSLLGRLFYQWPQIYRDIFNNLLFIIGFGPGIVGPGKFFGSIDYSVTSQLIDNQFIYSILSFGLLALILYIKLYKYIFMYKINNNPYENKIFSLCIFTFTLGLMQNFDPGLMIAFGIIFGFFKDENGIQKLY